jgi:hypothetical protein
MILKNFSNLSKHYCGLSALFSLLVIPFGFASTAFADPGSSSELTNTTLINAEPATNWVRVRSSITLLQLADQLDLSPELLSDINSLPLVHRLRPDDWVALPVLSRQTLAQIRSLDSSDIRMSAPARNPLATIAKFASEASPLQVTSQLMAPAAARARLPLAILPGGSGGLSWPDLPLMPKRRTSYPLNFAQHTSIRSTPPTTGTVQRVSADDCSSKQRYLEQADIATTDILRKLAKQRANEAGRRCNEFTSQARDAYISMKAAEESDRQMNWRSFGSVLIPWSQWKEVAPGKRSNGFIRFAGDGETSLDASARSLVNYTGDAGFAPSGVAISCDTATLSINVSKDDFRSWKLRHSSWTAWKAPEPGTHWEKILVSLCSNVNGDPASPR